jgi:PhnB protein
MAMPDVAIGHAEVEIGGLDHHDRRRTARRPRAQPEDAGSWPVTLFVSVEDGDDVFKQAVEAGSGGRASAGRRFPRATVVAMFDDPFGRRWNIASHIEDVAPQEMK